MLESIEYWLKVTWLIFLFIPLLFCVAVVVVAGVAAIWGMIANWIVPATNNMRRCVKQIKLDDEELERRRVYNREVADALSETIDKVTEAITEVEKHANEVGGHDELVADLRHRREWFTQVKFPRYP